MKRFLVLAVLLLFSPLALAQEAKNPFAELDAKMAKELASDAWHPATKTFIRAQWADYKLAHEKPGQRGDFHGARCYGGIVCPPEIDDIERYAGGYNFQSSSDNADFSPGPHVQIVVSPDKRVFVIENGQRYPAVVNNNILFYTDGTWIEQTAQLGTKPYARLEMTMIYQAKHFGLVYGSADAFVDDMLKLEKMESKQSESSEKK